MNQKSEIGKLGEDLACAYLKDKQYKIIERNFRKPWGELDIIAKQNNGTLVFIEVKTMRSRYARSREARQIENNAANNAAIAELKPEDNLTNSKLTKLKRTAYLYANENPKLVNDEKGWQIDLLAITLSNNKNPEIKHFENL